MTQRALRFGQIFVLFCAAQAWVLARTSGKAWLAYAVLMTACAAATFGSFGGRYVRHAFGVTFAAVVMLAAWRFPLTANHIFLQCIIALAVMVTRMDDEDECTTLVMALRRILIGVFFWSGVQKIVHGAYFDGSFLCWNIAKGTHDAWRWVANVMLPAADLANAARAEPTNECRFVSPFALVLSNVVYVSEIACAAVLLHPRGRQRGALVVAFVLVAIEIAMNEWVFAAFAANLLLLFARPKWALRARPVFVGWAILLALFWGRP